MNVFKQISFGMVVILICSSFTFASDDGEKKNSNAGVTIGISAGAVITGAAVFFIVKHMKKERLQGDSIITFVEQSFDSSAKFYEQYRFDLSEKYLQRMLPQYDQYEKYCRKRHRSVILDRDSIVNRIFYCQLLNNLRSMIIESDSLVLKIPIQADEIVELNRHEINNTVNLVLTRIKQLEEKYKDKREAIRYGFRKAINHINSIDSVMSEVYESEKLNFSMKCKYFFNRAVEKNDTVALEQFVNDCDYYFIDKEWCSRARNILSGTTESIELPEKNVSTKFKGKNSVVKKNSKISPIDSIHNEFKIAMESRNIDVLQRYITKYQKSKFRKKDTRIDSARILLDSLKIQLQKEKAYLASHPLLSDSNGQEIKVIVNGLQKGNESFFKEGITGIQDDLKNAYGIRSPASLVVEKKGTSLQFFLTAYVKPMLDASKKNNNDTVFFIFPGSIWGVNFLHNYGLLLNKKATEDKYIDSSLRDYLLDAKATVYIIRLNKNSDENITFYAYKNGDKPVFYDFFDVSSKKEKNIRIDGKTDQEIQIVGSQTVDSLKNRLLSDFFTND